MKKTAHLILVATSLLITPSPVLAVSPNDLRVTVAAIQQQVRSSITARHADRLQHRFTFYHSRLLQLLNKISQRAQIMADNGQNTVTAIQTIDQATIALNQAKDKGEEAVTLFQSINPDTYQTQREIALQARDLAQESRALFSQTRNLLQQAISQLRQAI